MRLGESDLPSLRRFEEGLAMRMRIACAVFAAGAVALAIGGEAAASSHKEAPFISRMPAVDATDFYMFRSYETGKGAFTTIIANYIPLQQPYGGPNYYTMDPNALYEIHIDNTGDLQEDITFQFRFQNPLGGAGGAGINIDVGGQMINIPILTANANGGAGGGVTPFTTGTARHVNETYGVKVVRGNRRTGVASDVTHVGGPGANATTFEKPLDNIGQKTFGEVATGFNSGVTAKYQAYANAHIYTNVTIPGCATTGTKIFVGQRRETFAVNLGTIFDLVNATVGQLTDGPGGTNNLFFSSTTQGGPGTSGVGSMNVTSIVMEVPTVCLVSAAAQPVIGGWTTASVRQARVINPVATYAKPSREGGAWAQVSRLGNPLVNEVIIGLKDKDYWNSSEPKNDAPFYKYTDNPTLPKLIELLLGTATYTAPKGTSYPRLDLRQVFETGITGVNAIAGGKRGEVLRLNTALPAIPASQQFRGEPGGGPVGGAANANLSAGGRGLGAAGCFVNGATPASIKVLSVAALVPTAGATCDPSGYPNGRRPGDDTVDLALRVVSGYLLTSGNNPDAPTGNINLGDFVQQAPNDQFLGDGAGNHVFPYLPQPLTGAANP
jgi:hypothetical protein